MTSCAFPPQRTTKEGLLILGKITRFLKQTAMGCYTLHRQIQIQTGEGFRASAEVEGTQRSSYHHSPTAERYS
ncbi:hypothetical protein TNCV_2118341 [Trichonephila clavipes]|nr:hypothetical protein TNCV_2118341 [Trichonephila clavipes]